MLIYAALLIGLGWAFVRLPGGFLPVDDQGFITTDVQTPADSSYARTEAAVEKVEQYLAQRAGVENVTFLTGFSFLGQGINTAQAFITLKDWSERRAEGFGRRDRRRHQPRPVVDPRRQDFRAAAAADRQSRQFLGLLVPPAGPRPEGLSGAGQRRRPPDRGSQCQPACCKRSMSRACRRAPQVNLMIDREKAGAFGVTFEDINNTISTNLGSNYINDFPNRGRMQRVIVQADRGSRMNADDILNYNVKNSRGQLVPFSSFATVEWSKGPTQIAGFNYYPAVRISGEARPGFTSGDAIAEMERLAGKLPRGFGYEWTGQSLQEKLSGSQAPFLLGLSALVVFLCSPRSMKAGPFRWRCC